MKEIPYASFYRRLAQGKMIPLPLACSLEITHRCNFKCVHCYIADDRLSAKADKRELRTRDIYKIIDRLAAAGVLWMVISGGEPFIHKDFSNIYLYAKKKGFIVIIYSNGTLIDDKVVEFLKENPPFEVQISLYATNSDIFEGITNAGGSFNKCLAGIKLLMENGIRVGIKTPLLKQNREEVGKVEKFAAEKGLHFMCNPVLFPPLDGGCFDSVEFCLPQVSDVLKTEKNGHGKSMRRFLTKIYQEIKRDKKNPSLEGALCAKLDGFNAALKGMIIKPNGDLDVKRYFPCVKRGYNLLKKGVANCWDSFLDELISERRNNNCLCKKCEYLPDCTICLNINAKTDDNNLCKIKHYYCKIAKLRKHSALKANRKDE